MFVALDVHRDVVVSADELMMKHADHNSVKYRCLFCDGDVEFCGSSASQYGCFRHLDCEEPCVADGNVSTFHRIAQEAAAKKMYNLLPDGSGLDDVDLEQRIGGTSDFVVADMLSKPARIAIEVIHKNTDISLKRRLQTLFAEGYAVMVVVVTTSSPSPDRIEYHLKQVGPIRVGRFDPQTWSMSLGSLIRPGAIDIDTPVWEGLPDYLC